MSVVEEFKYIPRQHRTAFLAERLTSALVGPPVLLILYIECCKAE